MESFACNTLKGGGRDNEVEWDFLIATADGMEDAMGSKLVKGLREENKIPMCPNHPLL